VPDLAVEVRSPSTWRFDIGRKKVGESLTSPLLAGFALAVEEIFELDK
jgi:Uma2 family endonuclease